MERGKWVFFQNCHLAPSFMPALERLVENIDPDKVGCVIVIHCFAPLNIIDNCYLDFLGLLKTKK